jgi:thiol-disulfide isomerase/thioredoxin
MKLKYLYGIIIVCLSLTSTSIVKAQKHNNKTAILYGKLLNFGATVELEDFSELQYIVPKSHNAVIELKEDSSFHVEIPIEKPAYFRLGRNKLYLSPGDRLDVVIDKGNPTGVKIKGKGSEANFYLRNAPFPKGGSYLDAGTNLKETPTETLEFLMEEAKKMQTSLDKIKGISKDFRMLESARIRADLVKSIFGVKGYAGIKSQFRKKGEGFIQEYIDAFEIIAKPAKDSLLKDFVDPKFLQIEVYRDILKLLPLETFSNKKYVRGIQDWENAVDLATKKIKPQNDKNILPSFRAEIASIQNPVYKDALNKLLDEKLKFGNGDLAKDLVFNKTDGSTTTLSSLKGKVIYIDIWATWCGPCLGEMPYLETLKEKYKSNENVAIVSLSIDDKAEPWLKNLEKRNPGGIQWHIDRAKLSDYEVAAIPRYILIDKDFKVAEMMAPRASDPKIEENLNRLLAK